MNRPDYFELHSADPDKAIAFFKATFGWAIDRWGDQPYWALHTGEKGAAGINGGLVKSRDGQPRTVNVVNVPSIDPAIESIRKNGGTIVVEKMAVPTVGWVAYFLEPTGNLMGVWQPDPAAA